jgi:hypothetical protein
VNEQVAVSPTALRVLLALRLRKPTTCSTSEATTGIEPV